MNKIALIVTFAFICKCLFAQPVNGYMQNVMMPSPAAASLGKVTDIPLSYYTGVPNINIPIYTLTEGPLSLPVSLSNHPSGVKVGEAPSWVGQNWSLNAGGIISRTVQHLKDEGGDGWIYSAAIPAPPVYDANGNIIGGDFCGFYTHTVEGIEDSEPDIFSFNCGNYSGKFYFKKDLSVVLVPQQDIKIVPQFSSNSAEILHLKGFVVTTPDGTKYLFGDTGDGSPAIETTMGVGGDYPEIPSSWYLKKIESVDSKFYISLNYSGDYSRNDFQQNRNGPCNSPAPGANGILNLSSYASLVKGHRIASIVTTTTTVTFTPGAAREDLEVLPISPYNTDPPKVLASITIVSGTFQRKFDFTYDYWLDNSSDQVTAPNNKLNKRLRLLSVQEKSVDGTIVNPAWNFEYFVKTGSPNFMPHRLSRSVDHWGFYNESNNGGYTLTVPNTPGNLFGSCEHGGDCGVWAQAGGGSSNRNTNEPPMKYGTIKKITYPTGGNIEFDFEANDVYNSLPVNDTIDIVHIDGDFNGGGFSCGTSTFYGNPQNASFSSSILNSAKIFWKLKPYNGASCPCGDGTTAMVVKVYNAGTGAYYAQSAVVNIGCPPANGNNNLSTYFTPALQADVNYKFELVVTRGGADFKIRLPIVNGIGNVKVGGLRVKQIKTHDGISTANDIIRTYEYRDSTITSQSSGILYGKPNYVYTYAWFPCRNPALCGSICAPEACTIFNLPGGGCAVNFYENSITPLSSFEGYHIGYYYVKENLNGNGYKTYTYYIENNTDPPQFPTPPAPARIQAGNLKYSTTRNSTGTILATEAHSAYNDLYTESTDVMYKVINNSCGHFLTVYKIRTRPYREATMVNTLDGVSTTTTYTYDSQNRHLQKVTEDITDSDGTAYRTKYKYALDYPCPSGNNCDETNGANAEAKAIYAMRKRYMIALPIEQTTWLKRPAWGSHRLTEATYFQYDKVNTSYDNLKLKTVQQIRPASPLTSFTESTTTAGTFTKSTSPAYSIEYNFVFSDTHGNLLSQWKQNDPAKEQYIWGHKNKLAIAKVTNAEDTEVAFTSFEELDNAIPQGNWILNGAAGGWSTGPGNYMTGQTGFNLSPARTISKSVPIGKYVVSGWHKDGSFVVNGATVSTSTGGQWKYAEKEITLASPGTITVSSLGSDWSQLVDELRLYPSDGLMQTFSFQENTRTLLSTSDENNVHTHYDFDVMQRLQAVRDQDRNIKQTYEYNFHPVGSVINEIKSRTVLISGQTTVAQVNTLTGANVKRVFQCLDGLGRSIQSNAVGQSPMQNDIITLQQYDIYGREPKKFIPYTIATNGGAFRSNAASEQLSFANTWGAGGYGYSETRFESSPLNRELEQAAPGATWRIGNGHTVEKLYRGNLTADAVRDFTNNNSFADTKLSVTEETDENERKKFTYTDKLGRVVMVRQQIAPVPTIEDDHWSRTYTVYDDFGRVAAVIPPEAAKKMKTTGIWTWTSGSYANMIYKYTYDSRGNMASKTIPSGGTTNYAYDRLDRQVLATDAKGFKIFTRYDILGRPVVSGRYKGTASPLPTNPLYEIPNTTAPHYYTSTSFPTDNNLDVYKVFYYDDYDLDNNGSLGSTETYTNPAETGFDVTAFLRTRGKTTATKTAILKNDNSAPTNYLISRTYYDKEYSLIQTNTQNHLSGADITSNAYDFADRLMKTRRDHTATPPGGTLKTYTTREEYVYDDASRLRFTRHKINTNNWIVLAAPVYDELDRLADNRIHASNYDGTSAVTLASNFNYLQSLDYLYNIRGWMTSMNDVASCSIQSGDQLADMFKLQLSYDSPVGGGTAQYNGNISTMQWGTYINSTCLPQQQYRLTYDANDRLTAGDHYTNNAGSWAFTNNYTESNITYDLNGNIKSYTRRGLTVSPATFGSIDQLTYYYDDATRPDLLTRVADAASATKGFKYLASASSPHYTYDLNGNLTLDKHKTITFTYNHLNLPNTMTLTGGSAITMTYTADGEKLTKVSPAGTRNYVAGIEYLGANTEAIYHAEGRCIPNGASAFHYEYTLKDHLGNARVNFRANGAAVTYLEDFHYYPFGMQMEGIGAVLANGNDYRYNGKELNEDLGLNLYDYGARWYDPAVGRWGSVDPLADWAPEQSPYKYGFNNPIFFIDVDGLFESRKEAKEYKKEHGTKGQVREQEDGTFAIENRKDGIVTFQDNSLKDDAHPDGVFTGALVVGTKQAEEVYGNYGGIYGCLNCNSSAGGEFVDAAENAIFHSTMFLATGKLVGLGLKGVTSSISLFSSTTFQTPAKTYTQATFNALKRQLAKDGMKSILKTRRANLKNIAEHTKKLENIKKAGGRSSSVERELRVWKSQLDAINDLLK